MHTSPSRIVDTSRDEPELAARLVEPAERPGDFRARLGHPEREQTRRGAARLRPQKSHRLGARPRVRRRLRARRGDVPKCLEREAGRVVPTRAAAAPPARPVCTRPGAPTPPPETPHWSSPTRSVNRGVPVGNAGVSLRHSAWSASRRSRVHAASVSPVPQICTAAPRAGPPFATRKCALHLRRRSSEHRSCVRVDCAGYCLQKYSAAGTFPATSPLANHLCQKSASTGHQPAGRLQGRPPRAKSGRLGARNRARDRPPATSRGTAATARFRLFSLLYPGNRRRRRRPPPRRVPSRPAGTARCRAAPGSRGIDRSPSPPGTSARFATRSSAASRAGPTRSNARGTSRRPTLRSPPARASARKSNAAGAGRRSPSRR